MPDQIPPHGRVRSYLTDKCYVHDVRDEPDIVDWCVKVGASTQLSDALSQWRRPSVCFQSGKVSHVLAAGITAALDAGAKHIALVRCIPRQASTDADNQDLVLALVRAASECDSLTLEDFHLLTPDEVGQFLDLAGGHCSLQALALSRVPGMNRVAMDLLVRLVLTSGILSLRLIEVDARVLACFLEALHQWSLSEPVCMKRLDISYVIAGEAEGRMTAQAQEQIDSINLLVGLLTSSLGELDIRSERSQVVLEDKPSGYGSGVPSQSRFNFSTTLTMLPSQPGTPSADNPGTPPENMVMLECIDTDEPPRQVPSHAGIEWNPRVVRRPQFLADICKGLGALWGAEESIMRRHLEALETASWRTAFALTDGEPSRLRWIREVNREHLDLWNDTYAKHLDALAREDMQAIGRMEALLTKGETFALTRYVKQLREKDALPPAPAIESLLSRHDDNPALKAIGLWAFKPIQAIEELASEGKADQLHMWANTLRRVDALPPFEQLGPLINRCLDLARYDVVQALYSFQPQDA